MPLVVAGKNAACDGIAAIVTHASLHTTLNDTGANEVTGGAPAYARKAITWSAASGGQRSNSAGLTFDVPAATTVVAFGLFTAITAGTFEGWLPINPGAKGFATLDISTDGFTSPAHGLTANTQVYFEDVFAVALPTGLARNTIYFVSATGLTTDLFKISATSGGSVIDLTVANSQVYWQSLVPEVFGSQGTLTVNAAGLVLDATGI